MYTPEFNREPRLDVLHEFIQQHSFATLLTCHAGELTASHLPFLLDANTGPNGMLRGHMARQNPQWRHLDSSGEVMVIFQGPHAYISPSYYAESLRVPTWNYAVVHAYGKAKLLDDEAVGALLEKTVNLFEAALPNPWNTQKLPGAYLISHRKALVGFEIEITRLEGKWKMNQNLTREDRLGVIEALSKSEDPSAVEIARIMRAKEESSQRKPE